MLGRWVILIGAAMALGLLVWAWANGGRQPVREISVPVAVPGSAR